MFVFYLHYLKAVANSSHANSFPFPDKGEDQGSRVQFDMAQKEQWQEFKVTDYMVSTVRMESNES